MISVVMPAYNEDEVIERTVREWYAEVIDRIPGAEFIVVNDCSKDRTGEILARLAAEIPALRPLTPERNGGHGKALRYGFDHVTQDWVFQTDSDRQHVPSDFWKLWNVRETSDFVLGVRSSRADGAVRVFITTVMRLANFAAWGLWIRDANCPFKLMRREPLQDVLGQIPRDSFIPMVMLSILCRKLRYRVREVNVDHLPRRGGEQSLAGLSKWLKVGSRCLCQLLMWRISLLWPAHPRATQSLPGPARE
ncbi:MAG TPA: glycosyltransferase family 2 protein [Bryobacteraceae bacterium]|nr:glycosyltransferase family 2 protein [Bryobacteraceae bacterium]